MSMVDSMASSSSISQVLIRLSGPIRETLEITPYTPPDGPNISIKSNLLSLLPPNPRESIRVEIRDFCLCCAALASAASVDSGPISWIPRPLSDAANSAVAELSEAVYSGSDGDGLIGAGDSDAHFSLAPKESRLVGELMPDVLPLLTGVIKESSIGSDDDDEIAAASARAPVAEAIIAAHQFRWFVTQVNYPYLGKVCNLVLPCALTALDHWSPEVKGQGMVSSIHLAKNVNAAELGWYEDVVLDACCRNIASSDELWHHVVEMSVLLVTCIQRQNPRSPWFERMLSEMLGHLERQPKNKQRRMSWLQLIEPLFNAMGLVLLAHFRRIFPLFFKWMHVDDDETVLLVLDLVHTIVKLTWIRNTPYIDRLVDELILIVEEGYTVLDVRDRTQYDRAHIKSCYHTPLFIENNDNDFGTIIKRTVHNNFSGLFFGLPFTKLNPDFVKLVKGQFSSDSKLLLVCQEGLRSTAAANKLEREGFQNLSCVTSGLQSVKPGTFESVGSTELQNAGKAGLVTVQGKISAILGTVLICAYLFITFFPEQAEKLLEMSPAS